MSDLRGRITEDCDALAARLRTDMEAVEYRTVETYLDAALAVFVPALAVRDEELDRLRAELEKARAVETQAVDYVDDLNAQILAATKRARRAEQTTAERNAAIAAVDRVRAYLDRDPVPHPNHDHVCPNTIRTLIYDAGAPAPSVDEHAAQAIAITRGEAPDAP